MTISKRILENGSTIEFRNGATPDRFEAQFSKGESVKKIFFSVTIDGLTHRIECESPAMLFRLSASFHRYRPTIEIWENEAERITFQLVGSNVR